MHFRAKAGQLTHQSASNRIPKPDRAVVTGRGQELAVRTESHTVNTCGMCTNAELFGTGRQVPDPNGAVRACNDGLAVLAKPDMPKPRQLQGGDLAVRRVLPQSNSAEMIIRNRHPSGFMSTETAMPKRDKW